jgi:hypothetical protein
MPQKMLHVLLLHTLRQHQRRSGMAENMRVPKILGDPGLGGGFAKTDVRERT